MFAGITAVYWETLNRNQYPRFSVLRVRHNSQQYRRDYPESHYEGRKTSRGQKEKDMSGYGAGTVSNPQNGHMKTRHNRSMYNAAPSPTISLNVVRVQHRPYSLPLEDHRDWPSSMAYCTRVFSHHISLINQQLNISILTFQARTGNKYTKSQIKIIAA